MAVIAPVSSQAGSGIRGERNYTFAQTVLTLLFFMWGFLTCLNDILIPHLKAVFELNYTQVMLTQFCFFFAYFLVSLPAGRIVEKIGYQRGIIIGLLVAGLGSLFFYPAAGLRLYPLFLLALFVLASGITLLEVAANPYVAILGRPEYASSRLNLAQAFNSLGTTIAPYLGSLFILSVAVKLVTELRGYTPQQLEAYKLTEASSVQTPYLVLSCVLLLIAGLFALIKIPSITEGTVEGNEQVTTVIEDSRSSAWGYRHLVLGAIGIFVYVGAEVSIGSFLVNYLGQPYIAGLKESQAGKLVSFYWGGAMVGRFLGSWVQRYIKPSNVLTFNAFTAGVLVITTMLTYGQTAMVAVLFVGFFNSIMFPTIFTLAIDGLGKHMGQGSGIICMAIVGGAIIPVAQGFIADRIGIHHAFILPVLCYLFIIYYGISGYKHKILVRVN
jgi:FHS family L-fucose permease-like MFS transporter